MGKAELAAIFSADPDRFYKVSLFDRMGFKRQKCSQCSKFFWAIPEKESCPDHEHYSFIGKPPTNKRLDYVNAWKVTEEYFHSNGHSIIRRYPVVCRWRNDLYFTIASIIDFQRVSEGKVIFELPSNPLVVPQMCLRFNDIENVGLSGRHYTSFCMIGQTCDANAPGGYWKDRCIDLDFSLLTKGLGINSEEITFVEDVWIGAGAFGYSLEYFASGLELGNAVFTEFEGNETEYRVMTNKVIDMGAGLERLSWITMGTPTSYDCCFGPVIQKLYDYTGINENSEILAKYFAAASDKLDQVSGDISALKSMVAKELNISYDSIAKIIAPFEAMYTIADHTRTLLFAISDGALPSNVGGGYNLRVVLRRALSILDRLGWNFKIDDIADLHIDYLKQMYPELEEHRGDVRTILQIESNRYIGSRKRMDFIAGSIKSAAKEVTVDDLIRLYESDGITPEFLMETGVIQTIPPTFYTKLSELHTKETSVEAPKSFKGLSNLPSTRLLFYEDEYLRDFAATILRILDKNCLVLDQTAFYPRGGGQEPDTGELEGKKVIEVTKQGNIVIHKLENTGGFSEGDIIHCKVNSIRRDLITKHHTATHVLNTSARTNLGSWVWQNSAFKDESYARLDITHHSGLSREEVERIERTANNVIRRDLPVSINTEERVDAEHKYSFRIYQGGAVPSANVRIVNIENWDIEACGGTHVNKTGQLGLIKIIKTERVQDGVVRLEFVAGDAAINYIQKQENQLITISEYLGSSREKLVESFQKSFDEAEASKKKMRTLLRKISPLLAKSISAEAKTISSDGLKLYSVHDDNELDDEYYISIGQYVVQADPCIIFIALISKGQGIRVVVFVGKKARERIKADYIAKMLSTHLGGSGGGDDKFAQGGGRYGERIKDALLLAEGLILKNVG